MLGGIIVVVLEINLSVNVGINVVGGMEKTPFEGRVKVSEQRTGS